MVTKKDLIIRVTGGLGNQLFQLSNAYLLAQKGNRKLSIDWRSGFFHDKKYRRKPYWYNKKHSFVWYLTGFISFAYFKLTKLGFTSRKYIHVTDTYKVSEDIISNIKDTHSKVYLDGYLQDTSFLFESREIVKSFIVELEMEYGVNLITVEEQFSNEFVAVHIRWFDGEDKFMDNGFKNYFFDISKMLEKDNPTYCLYTNDRNRTATFFDLNFPNMKVLYLDKKDLFEDFVELQRYKKLILTTSTFGWWAGFLGNSSTIILPNTHGDHMVNWGGLCLEKLRRGSI